MAKYQWRFVEYECDKCASKLRLAARIDLIPEGWIAVDGLKIGTNSGHTSYSEAYFCSVKCLCRQMKEYI